MHQVEPLSMGWCLECHRDPEPHRRPLSEITNMTWKPPRDPEARARQLAELPPARPARRLLGVPPMSTERRTGAASGSSQGSAESRSFREREFAEGASEPPDAVSRREVLTLLGASLSLAGLAACRRPEETHRSLRRGPGAGGAGRPAALRDHHALGQHGLRPGGREPRGPAHEDRGQRAAPGSLGSSSARVQAAILDLYDPDRSQEVLKDGEASSWDAFVAAWAERAAVHAADGGSRPRGAPAALVLAHALPAGRGAARGSTPTPWSSPTPPPATSTPTRGSPGPPGRPLRPGAPPGERRRRPVPRRRHPPRGPGDDPSHPRLRPPPAGLGAGRRDEPPVGGGAGALGHRRQGRPPAAPARAAGSRRSPPPWPPVSPRRASGSRPRRALDRRGWTPAWLQALAEDLLAHQGTSLIVAGPQPAPGGPRRRPGPERRPRQRGDHRRVPRAGRRAPGPAPRPSAPGRRDERRPGADPRRPRRQPGLRRPGRPRLRRGGREASSRSSTWAPTGTRPRPWLTGTCPPRTSSRPGATPERPAGRSRVVQPLILPLYGGKSTVEVLGLAGPRRRRPRLRAGPGDLAGSPGRGRLREPLAPRPPRRRAARQRRSPRWTSSRSPGVFAELAAAAAARTDSGGELELLFRPCPKVHDGAERQQRLAPGASRRRSPRSPGTTRSS